MVRKRKKIVMAVPHEKKGKTVQLMASYLRLHWLVMYALLQSKGLSGRTSITSRGKKTGVYGPINKPVRIDI